jgi:hypothetical protein
MNRKQKERLWNKYDFWKATHPLMGKANYEYCEYCLLQNDLDKCVKQQGWRGAYRDRKGEHLCCIAFLLKKNYVGK